MKNKGIVLTEWMIIIAIVAILLAFIMPVFCPSSKDATAPKEVKTVEIQPVRKFQINGEYTTFVDEVEIDGQRYWFCAHDSATVFVLKVDTKAEK